MKLVKQIGYKLIVAICIVVTFCGFIASTPVEASKVNTSEFYYSGTIKGSYTVETNFFQKMVASFDQILDYVFGALTMAVRVVFVGWTAFMERCLTWIFEAAIGEEIDIEKVSTTNITGSDDYITLDAIFFNRVPLLDINFFKLDIRDDVTGTGMKKEDVAPIPGESDEHDAPMIVYADENVEIIQVQGQKNNLLSEPPPADDTDESLVMVIKKAIASWYYTFRLISIMVMLVLLVYIGLKIAIQVSAQEKALYKRILLDWLVGMVLVFSVHYIMLFIIQFNEIIVEQVSNWRDGATGLKVYEYGLIERASQPVENDELEMTLYEEVKTRAYDAKLTVGTVGMVMYMVLVYYAWKFSFRYLKRYLTVAVLAIASPFVAVSYAFNKVNTGKSTVFAKWLKEFTFIVILQSVHAILYVIFLDTALAISLNSIAAIILVFMLLNFMCKAEDIFRKIFNIRGDLEDITKGGIRDAIDNLKVGLMTMGAGKFAAKFTKQAVRFSTKPVRAISNAAFGGIMLAKVNNANNPSRIQKANNKKLNEAERLEKIRKGSIAKAIQSKSIDIDKLRTAVDSLQEKKGQFIVNQEGEDVFVDDKYIAKEREALQEIEQISGDVDKLAKQFDKMTSKGALAKQYVGRKWEQIMNPYQYVEMDEKGKYHAVKTSREFGRLGKKTDSVGMRFTQQLKADKLLGLDKETKEGLKKQVEFVKNELVGFAGIGLGLPLLVAEPKVSSVFLYAGVQRSMDVFGSTGRHTRKNLTKIRPTPNGKYKLVGFEGKSQDTIAEEAKFQARAQAKEIFLGKAMHDAKVVNNVKTKHPKLYARLKGSLGVAGAVGAAGATMKLAKLSSIPTVTVTTLGVAAGVMTGAALYNNRSNFSDNVWHRRHETTQAARRANAKLYAKQVKGMDTYLSHMADKYFEMEADQHKNAADRHANDFAELYLAIQTEQAQEIDTMEDNEVRRELGYEDIEIIKHPDGKKTLSGSSENEIIDNAIIATARKAGIMNIGQFELSSTNVKHVARDVENKLRQLGIVEKGASVSTVIKDIEKSIKDRQAILAKEGTKPVEEKMADQAIIEMMRADSSVTDPSKLKPEAVLEKYKQIKHASFGGERPTQDSSTVINNMNKVKGNDGNKAIDFSRDGSRAIDMGRDGSQSINIGRDGSTSPISNDDAKIIQMITARRTILAQKDKKKMDQDTSKYMREVLKRKRNTELNTTVLEKQSQLEEQPGLNITGIVTNETGGINSENDGSVQVQPQKSDKVLEMLQLQTKMYQDRMKLEKVTGASSNSKKLKAYKKELFEADGSVKAQVWKDGSKAVSSSDGSRRVNTVGGTNIKTKEKSYGTMKMDELLRTLNNK